MKKSIAATAMAMTVLFSAVTVSAADNNRSDLTLFVPNDPVYTITVPETVALSATENTQVPITASDVKYIPEGKKISAPELPG